MFIFSKSFTGHTTCPENRFFFYIARGDSIFVKRWNGYYTKNSNNDSNNTTGKKTHGNYEDANYFSD